MLQGILLKILKDLLIWRAPVPPPLLPPGTLGLRANHLLEPVHPVDKHGLALVLLDGLGQCYGDAWVDAGEDAERDGLLVVQGHLHDEGVDVEGDAAVGGEVGLRGGALGAGGLGQPVVAAGPFVVGIDCAVG